MPDFSKYRDHVALEVELGSWLAIHGNLCLALRHPGNNGASRDIVERFVQGLGIVLVERGLLTPEELAQAERLEQDYVAELKARERSRAN